MLCADLSLQKMVKVAKVTKATLCASLFLLNQGAGLVSSACAEEKASSTTVSLTADTLGGGDNEWLPPADLSTQTGPAFSFGDGLISSPFASPTEISTVPEPCGLSLLLCAGIILMLGNRFRNLQPAKPTSSTTYR
jgi:hypothetical protein